MLEKIGMQFHARETAEDLGEAVIYRLTRETFRLNRGVGAGRSS
ncbi:hypothetical protein [Neolewinella xylanilytica]